MKKWIIGVAALSLSACATSATEAVSLAPDAADTAVSSLPKLGLGPQVLESGECGLFLWSITNADMFIFFSKANSEQALFAQESAPLKLEQTSASGDIFGQFQTRLGYTEQSGVQYDLIIAPGEEMNGGQRISSGLFTITDREGWKTKLPVLGVRACQPD